MKRRFLVIRLGCLIILAGILPVATRGEDATPPPPAPAAAPAPQPAGPPPAVGPTASPTATPAVAAEAAPAPAAPATSATPSSSDNLRRLDEAAAPAAPEPKAPAPAESRERKPRHVRSGSSDQPEVSVLNNTQIEKDEVAQAAVSILGSTTVDGEVRDAAVSIGGTTTVNGSAGDAAVAVMGDVRVDGSVGDAAVSVGGNVIVNGRVHGDVVSIGGRVTLGPKAVVDGQVVVVGAGLEKAPGAVIHGQVQRIQIPAVAWVFSWVKSALLKGRLLSFAGGAFWAWLVAAAFLVFYLLLALLFPKAVTRCAETLEQRPGFTFLAALLTMMAMPLVFVLLAITGVGALVVPFLGFALFVGKLFGRASMLAWYGRRLTGWAGGGRATPVALSVLVGGLLVMLLYLVPLVAFLVLALNSFLGLGMVVYTVILSMRRNGAKPAPAAPAPGGGPMAGAPVAALATAAAGESAAAGSPPVVAGAAPGVPVPPMVTVPPLISAATLPRAGFWIRLAAMGVDLILVLLVIRLLPGVHGNPSLFGFLLLGYGAVMWKLRGTTVGGSIFHLKVVRLDDRPLDWTAAIVRVLACLISLVVAGLGFIWVAFDEEKQSWHDKVAGTTVVRVPKGVSLI